MAWMRSIILPHKSVNISLVLHFTRLIVTKTSPCLSPQPPPADKGPKNTHFKITLHRSAISLGDKLRRTLISLGIHRRHQTVYHKHSPEVAGKILGVKELVEVGNVPEELVRTKQQQTGDRKATRGYRVVRSGRWGLTNV